MDTLTKTQLARQDFVDNAIYDLLQEINPSKEKIDWDIEVIGEIRDIIQFYFVDRFAFTDAMSFYPYIDEKNNESDRI